MVAAPVPSLSISRAKKRRLAGLIGTTFENGCTPQVAEGVRASGAPRARKNFGAIAN